MKRILIICFLMLLAHASINAQSSNKWCGSAKLEMSVGLAADASDYKYKSFGVAASYGLLFNNNFFAGLGINPNYTYANGDHSGFYMPVYGEFKYQSTLNSHGIGGYGVGRVGYSPVDKRGMYAHLGGGVAYKRFEFGIGVSYQYAEFTEVWFSEPQVLDYHLVFATLSLGFRF